MKIIFYNIKNFVRHHTGFFVLMIITVFFSSIVMLFSYGLFQNYKLSKIEYTSSQKTITIGLNTDESDIIPMTKGEIIKCISALDSNTSASCEMICVESIIGDCEIPLEDTIITELDVLSRFLYNNGTFKCYYEMYDTLKKQGWFLGGRYYTDAEYNKGEPLIILPSGLSNNSSELIIQGKTFKEAAVIKGEPDVIFTALEDNTQCIYVGFYFRQPPSLTQYNDICNTFKNTFGNRIHIPDIEPFYQEDYWLYNTIMLSSVLIAVVASINLIIIYQYILLKRRKTLSIFMICGCRKNEAVMCYLSESMIITMPCFILSAFLYHNILLKLFATKFVYIESAYTIKLYIIAFIIYTFVSSIAMFIISSIMVRKASIIQLKAGE